MLEDPSYSSVVRWGDEMDSFVVLEVFSCEEALPALLLIPFDRTNDSPNRSSPNISNTATSLVSFGNSTSMTFTRCDTITRRMEHRRMGLG